MGVKLGLESFANAAVSIEESIVDCPFKAVGDIAKITQIASVFANPISLMFNMGENLLLNGIDIYSKVKKAIEYEKSSDYFNFGKEVGKLMTEVFIQAPLIKKSSDRVAFEFFRGFVNVAYGEADSLASALYNNIEGAHSSISDLLDSA